MKKTIALLLTLVMVFALFTVSAHADGMDDLIAAAKADGELVVYGSCEEDYLAAACQNFEKLYGIKTTYQRLSTSPPLTSGSAAPTTPMTAWPPRASWITPTSPRTPPT